MPNHPTKKSATRRSSLPAATAYQPLRIGVFGILLLLAKPAHAERVALIVGANIGHSGDTPLRYAEADADRIAALLTRIGGVSSQNAFVIKGRNADEVLNAFTTVAARLRQLPAEREFFFYYSGHASATNLHLNSTSLPIAELKRQLLELPATVRVAILDACQSGTMTRLKGGQQGIAFDVSNVTPNQQGLAILASTSDSEFAQESDELEASFFTHHIEVGLRGIADRNKDGQVSLSESFDYAAERTVSATIGTAAGPQHPTFRYDLAGTSDVIVTYPGTTQLGFGKLVFDLPGWYFVRRSNGRLLSEVRARAGNELLLEAGDLEVLRREQDALSSFRLQLSSGKRVLLSSLHGKRVPLGRAVRKGWSQRTAVAISLAASAQTSILQLGTLLGAGVSARWDRRWGSVEARLGGGYAQSHTFVASSTWNARIGVAALYAWDARSYVVAAGVEAALNVLSEQIESDDARTLFAPSLGPTLLAEFPFGTNWNVRTELTLPVYGLRTTDHYGNGEFRLATSLRFGAGVGHSF